MNVEAVPSWRHCALARRRMKLEAKGKFRPHKKIATRQAGRLQNSYCCFLLKKLLMYGTYYFSAHSLAVSFRLHKQICLMCGELMHIALLGGS